MKIKNVTKFIIVMLLILMVINNISYAINITNDDLKNSLKRIFGSTFEIKMETEKDVIVEGGDEGVTVEGNPTIKSTVTTKYEAPEELIVTDSEIILKEKEDGEEYTFSINYKLENNVVSFNSKFTGEDIGIENIEDATMEDSMLLFGVIMEAAEQQKVAFLAIADCLGVDLELANSYYEQLGLSEQTANIDDNDDAPTEEVVENDLYKKRTYIDTTNFIFENNLDVNLEKLEEITENDLDGTVKTTITILSAPGNDNTTNNTSTNYVNNTINNKTNVVNNTVNNAANNTTNLANNTANNVGNNTSNKVKNTNVSNNTTNHAKDNTVANKIIPAAGGTTVYCIVLSLIAISLLIYVRIRKIDEDMR